MERKNRRERPSMMGKRSLKPKMLSINEPFFWGKLLINEPDPCAVPCSSQGSAAAAESYTYLNDDTCSDSTMDFGTFEDDDDEAKFPKLCLPMYSPEPFERRTSHSEILKFIEDYFGVSSSTSCGGTTASASCYNSVSLESYMNEEDAVDSLPQPPHQDRNGEVNDHAVKGQSSEISNSYNETTVNNDEASRPDASVDPQNLSNSIEIDYNEEPSQPDENEELNDHAVKCQSSEINDSYKETTVNNEDASRPDASIDPQNFSNSIEMDYSEKTSQPASRPSSSAGGQSISLELHNSHVKFKVKSFTVPEFFVVVPETASVGFLKKAILEKATAMVGREGHLDVLLQGENTRDENEFMPKAGTSLQNKLDVILEPEYLQDLNGLSPKLSCIPLPSQPQTRCTPSTSVVHQGTTDTSPDSFMSLLGLTFQDNHERLELRTNVPIANSISSMTATTCSKVIGSVPKSRKVKPFKCKKHLVMDENTLDVGLVHQKPNSSEDVKRRKIEYFSILEVEKLVKAVEELGTGSWAKIKEQAFGQDSRRTRTDLRDKWETLLKTAETPSEKRRGPKLSQELLDRVVAINTRNSQHRDLQS